MRPTRLAPLSLLFATAVLAGCGSDGAGSAAGGLPGTLQMTTKAPAKAGLGDLPLRFEANRGQTDGRVRYLTRGPGYTPLPHRPRGRLLARRPQTGPAASCACALLGADAEPAIAGTERLPGVTNYLRGSDRGARARTSPSYASVRYRNAYRGIDVAVPRHAAQRLEYDFVVAPRRRPGARIALGVRRRALAEARRAQATADRDRGRRAAPAAARSRYQQIVGGRRRAVRGATTSCRRRPRRLRARRLRPLQEARHRSRRVLRRRCSAARRRLRRRRSPSTPPATRT